MRRLAILLAALAGPGAARALDLPLPAGAELTAEDAAPAATVALPSGPWRDGAVPVVEVRGDAERRAWRVTGPAATPDALLAPLDDALSAQGFAPVFACADRACGGYDFRFALPLLSAPAMHVDLGDYRYLLAARETPAGTEHVAVVTSRGSDAGYVHVTGVVPAAAAQPPAQAAVAPAAEPGEAPSTAGILADRLLAGGHVVLEGLVFPSGSSSLSGDRYQSLADLAAFLEAYPSAVVALVGHTDAVGALDANVRLSRARAQAVRTRLIGTYNADPARILAEGAGFLAPVASNLTDEGRAANRRVEAVLLSNG